MEDEEVEALDQLAISHRELQHAQRVFEEAMMACYEACCTQQDIGEVLGIGQQAVSGWFRRRLALVGGLDLDEATFPPLPGL